jgi:uncharacterized protein YdaU (DUF1376 family)
MFSYDFHIGDWRKSTGRLSLLERAVFRELLDELYDSERPLPESVEILAELLGLEKVSEISALRSVLKKKFVAYGGGLIQLRAWSQIMALNELRETRRKNGREGGLTKHRRLLEQNLASASSGQPESKQNLATQDSLDPVPSTLNPQPCNLEPGVPAELAAGDTRTGSDSGGGTEEEVLPSGIEYPPGWPSSAEKAVGHVISLLLPVPAHGPPQEDWVKEVWLQAVGRNFCDGAQVRITQFAHWVHGRWSREGQEWLARREAAKPREKKEGAVFSPLVLKEPEFPWRKVVLAEWGYVPEAAWELQTARKRREIEAAWGGMSEERRAEVVKMGVPGLESVEQAGGDEAERA